MQQYTATVKEIKYLTQNVVEVSLSLVQPDTAVFEAGQFMNFQLPGGVRSYSIVSVPDHNSSLSFCVQLLEKGAGSDFFRRCRHGDQVTLQGPAGIFTVKDFSRNIFFIATGVGAAPYASMIPDMLGKGFQKKARLLFSVSHEEDVFYFDRFNHLQALYQNFTFTPILTRPRSHWPGETGRVTTYLDVAYEYYKDWVFYLCGGAEAVGQTRELLLRKGHEAKDIRTELFS